MLKIVNLEQYDLNPKPEKKGGTHAIAPLEDGFYNGFIESVAVNHEEKLERYRKGEWDKYKRLIWVTLVFPDEDKVSVDEALTERRMTYVATLAYGQQSNFYRDVLSNFATPVTGLVLVDEDGEQVTQFTEEKVYLRQLVLVSKDAGFELIGCPVGIFTEVRKKKDGTPFNKVIKVKPREGSYLTNLGDS